MALIDKHVILEKNATLLLIFSLLVVTVGGIVEIAPLFYLQNTIEKVDGVRPYTPLELAGRNVYIREGCYVCHSQMIRPMRDEVERYGHYSLAAESMYDHPFQWVLSLGSKKWIRPLSKQDSQHCLTARFSINNILAWTNDPGYIDAPLNAKKYHPRV